MINNFEKLKNFVETSGNCVNLGRHLKAGHPGFYQWILDNTEFLNSKPKVKDTERIYCIINSISSIQMSAFNKPAKFVNIFVGYSLSERAFEKHQNYLEKISIKEEQKSERARLRNEKSTEFNKLEHIKQNSKRRNPHLYEDSAIEGYDYVVCPESGARMSMIKNNYITNVLRMSIEEYNLKYPNLQKTCKKRLENISVGLNKVDESTGKTKYELSQEKARIKLSLVDESGLSGYDKKGLKTKSTHMSKLDEFGRNGYSRIATKAIIKGNNTKVERGLIVPPDQRNYLGRYRTVVLYLTSKHRSTLTEGYKTGLAGTPDAWHIDHKYSIQSGFKNKISPFVIGHIQNLEMLPWLDNVSKSSDCSITIEELFRITNYTPERSLSEFNSVMNLIYQDDEQSLPPNAAFLLERLYESIL